MPRRRDGHVAPGTIERARDGEQLSAEDLTALFSDTRPEVVEDMRQAADALRAELAGAGATGAAEERGSGVADAIDVPLADLARSWERGLPRALGWDDGGMAATAATAEGR